MSLSGEEPQAAMSLSRRSAAVIVVGGLALSGAIVGALWSWLAPPAHGVVALTRSGQRIQTYLGSESDHLFVAAAMLIGMLTPLAIIAAVLVWQWRAHRGPVLVTALWVGSVAAAATAAGVGAALAHWRYGSVPFETAPVTPEHRIYYFTEAPPVFFAHGPLQIATTLLFPAAIAALVYALMAVATPRDDLGASPAQEHPDLLIPAQP
ncbi:membrane protein [Mycolicibacterium anyangense]|uniref:Membrane protein n=2 Tax=Mycolicibacterium anyangense TaxID=1431246 RepID=A0A6N4W556_9MYCO|nr:membrane protein [Mycolicibacterium anyangense]